MPTPSQARCHKHPLFIAFHQASLHVYRFAMALTLKIQEASARNTELFHILHETESAVPDLDAQKRYIDDLEQQFAEATKKLKVLTDKRKRELKEHESYRDSVMKRFAYKISGKTDKFEARAAKEEREYFDALQEEHQVDVSKANLHAMLQEAKEVRADLEARVATHDQAQTDLDNLYDSIFNGPSPGFREEDEREAAKDAAVRAYHEARSQAESEGQVVSIMFKAQKQLNAALMSMDDALHASRADMFGGGTFADMMERNALSNAEMHVNQARELVGQARRISPHVHDLPPVTIKQGNLLGDVFFDNVFSDMAFHEKIHQSNLEVNKCAQALSTDLSAAQLRHSQSSRETDRKGAAVQEARLQLQKAREAAFESISAHALSSSSVAVPPPDGPPPSYTAAAGSSADNWWE